MNTNLEIEFKTLLTFKEFTSLQAIFPDNPTHTQINTYYDDAARSCLKRHWMMRIRTIGDTYEFTLKIPQTSGVLEVNLALPSDRPDSPDLRALCQQYEIAFPLIKVASSKTTRTTAEDLYGQFCLDQTEFDDRSLDYELEYELYRADDQASAYFQQWLFDHKITYKKGPAKVLRALKVHEVQASED